MDLNEWNEIVTTVLHSHQYRSVRITMAVSGTLSLLGAGYIIQDILKDASRRKATKERIMLFMSTCDALISIVDAIPNNLWAPRDSGIPGAIGNNATCSISGFISETCFYASASYNVTLAFCYLLIVNFEYSDDRLRRLEPYFLSIPIVYSLLFSIPGLPYQMYNADGLTGCPITPAPVGCDWPGSPVECTRGTKDLFILSPIVDLITFVVGSSIILYCMAMMFRKVLQRERSGDRFRFSIATRQPRRDLSNMMKNQGLWYSAAFFLTFLPNVINMLIVKGKGEPLWWYQNLTVFCLHSIGFINMIIYVRPRYVKFRRDNPNVGILSSVWHTLARSRPDRGRDGSTTRTTVASSTLSKSPSPPQWRSISGVLKWMRCLRRGDKHAAEPAVTKEEINVEFPIASASEYEEATCEETANCIIYPGGSVEEQAIDRSQHDEVEDWGFQTKNEASQ